MLRPAQLYKDKLEEENIKSWYKPENIYWNGSVSDNMIELPDNNGDRHCFVSVDQEDNVIGYISYALDWVAMSAFQLAIISYRKNSIEFARDVRQAIFDLFYIYNMNRVEWSVYADNPAIRGYRNFIKRYGGRECGYYRQFTRLQDGKLHDSVSFEILASEFNKAVKQEEKHE